MFYCCRPDASVCTQIPSSTLRQETCHLNESPAGTSRTLLYPAQLNDYTSQTLINKLEQSITPNLSIMLDDIRTWLKGIFQKNQDPSGACVMPGPRPESKRYAASGFIPVAEPTPCVSLAIQTPKSRSLRRSPGSPSLLQRYDPDRTDASRVTVPSPVTTTQPTSSVMRPTVLPPLTSRQHTATDFKSRRMATPACPPDWFPSGTISMISRTTHQTYSADPSPLFTGAAQNVGLSPVTTAVVTPSPAPKTSRVLQNNVPVVRNLVPPVMDPSLLEQAPPVAEKDTTNVKTITTSREKISGETFWIKVSGSGHSPQLPADSGVVSAVVLPSTSTPAKPQIIHGVQAKSPIILDVAIVDSPEGSVASSSESSINTVRRRAVAASAVFKSCESCDLDAAVSQVFDGTVPPSILTDEAPPNIAALEPDTLGLRIEGNGVDVHHIPWQQWSFPNASQTPDDIQYTPCPELPLLVSPPRFFNDQAQSIDTRPTQMVEHADPGPVIDHDNNDGGSASHSSRPLMEPTSFMPNGKYDSGQERQLGNALGLSSPPVSQMDLLQPPNVVPHMTSSDVPPHVNYIMTSSVHQGPCSVVGPNAFPFAADQLPPTAFVPDFSLCPRYAAHSLLEYLPFRCPELLPSIPTYISADKKHWVTSDYIDILPVELPLWHEGGQIQHNSQHSIQDDRPRIYTTLGIVSQSPGIINYLVYNGKSHRIPHMLTLWSPAGMDSVELRLNTNHLKFLRYLAGKPNHPNLAVYYNDEPTIWCCRDEFIWYLSVKPSF